jgi:protein disulfide-isomerase A6
MERHVHALTIQKASLPHALLVHPSAPSIPFLWKVLGHRLSNKASLGYVRDTPKHEILTSLNAYEAGSDSARLIFWGAGADADTFSVYDGEF